MNHRRWFVEIGAQKQRWVHLRFNHSSYCCDWNSYASHRPYSAIRTKRFDLEISPEGDGRVDLVTCHRHQNWHLFFSWLCLSQGTSSNRLCGFTVATILQNSACLWSNCLWSLFTVFWHFNHLTFIKMCTVRETDFLYSQNVIRVWSIIFYKGVEIASWVRYNIFKYYVLAQISVSELDSSFRSHLTYTV